MAKPAARVVPAARADLVARLAARHAERVAEGLGRRLRTVEAAYGARVVVDGRELVGFAGNDYLGLAAHPAVRDALILGARRYGVGSTAAHLLGGHRAPHAELEATLAEWTGREAALLFSTGWMANLGLVATLLGEGELCVQDRLNHACLIDGARLAGAELRRYPHGDPAGAARRLRARPGVPALLATDGVFSMDGDLAPLVELAALARAEGATLMVDDAHGLGVLGPDGAGCVAAAGLGQHEVPVLMATFGKALGTFGAFVAGSRPLIDALVQFARTHVYTTAMPPALACATLAAVRVARMEPWRREQLARLVRHFRAGAGARGLALGGSTTPIQPLIVGDARVATRLATMLGERGFFVPAIRPPTVPPGSARLRITLSALHTESDIEALLDALVDVRTVADAD
jgi:8-amino-7-oxononanoate synthase